MLDFDPKNGHILDQSSPLQVKMAPHHLLTCVTSLLVRPVPKVSIIVVATAKIVTKEAKNGHIMVIFSHKEKPYGPDTYLT